MEKSYLYKVSFYIRSAEDDTDDLADDIEHRLYDLKPEGLDIFEVFPWSKHVGG